MSRYVISVEEETTVNIDVDLSDYVDDIRDYVTENAEETLEWFDNDDLLNQLKASGETFEFSEIESLLKDDTAQISLDDIVAKCGREPAFLNDLNDRIHQLMQQRTADLIIEVAYTQERLTEALSREAVLRAKVAASLADLQSSETLTDIQ